MQDLMRKKQVFVLKFIQSQVLTELKAMVAIEFLALLSIYKKVG